VSEAQNGFRKERRTEAQYTPFSKAYRNPFGDRWGRGIEIFCDLTKACKFINHILFAKLNSYGFERHCEFVV
jgi:hypothetical protein